MKAYVEVPESARSLLRIRDALVRNAPSSVEFTDRRDEADLVVLHVNGRLNRNSDLAEHLLARGQRYAVVQYCLRSTKTPSPDDWAKLWSRAAVVWSYLDLALSSSNSYRSALGVGEAFTARLSTRSYIIGTSGLSWLTEGVREAANAAWLVGRRVFHLGPIVSSDSRITCRDGISDMALAKYWSRCDYVSGLRRTEGFELPAAEGLVCGARPVLFDREHYRHWYGDLAEYIPESSREEVVDSLAALFRSKIRRVKKSEQREARKRFDWKRIIGGFWERCGA